MDVYYLTSLESVVPCAGLTLCSFAAGLLQPLVHGRIGGYSAFSLLKLSHEMFLIVVVLNNLAVQRIFGTHQSILL